MGSASNLGKVFKRSLASGALIFSASIGLPVNSVLAAPPSYDKQTVAKQIARVDKQEQKGLREEAKDPNNVIAKGIVRLPEVEGFPLGPERAGTLNFGKYP